MAFGITAQGFSRKRLDDIQGEWEDTLRDRLGKNINLLPESVLGVIVGIASEREAEWWEQLEASYYAKYPSTAEGVNLDRVAEVTGSLRASPLPSTIINQSQILFGTPGTVIDADSVVSVAGNPDARFKTLAAVTLVAGSNETHEINYSSDPVTGSFDWIFGGHTIQILAADTAGDVQTKIDNEFGADKITVTGTQTAAGGLVFEFIGVEPDDYGKRDVPISVIENNTLADITPIDVDLTIAVVEGVPQGSVNMQAEEDGATLANTGTLTEIETPVSGWDATVNQEDAVLGRGAEADPDFRIRRDAQVAEAGSCTPNAVQADVEAVEGVTAAVIFYNKNAIADLEGRPPHSVDIVVQGGDEDELAEAIFETVGGGIETIGDVIKTVIDSEGFGQTVKFSRPSEVDIWVEVTVTKDAFLFPLDGATQVRDAILAYAATLAVGEDVVVHGSSPSLENSMAGVRGIIDLDIKVGIAPSPTLDDNVEIQAREIADFDSSRIAITVV